MSEPEVENGNGKVVRFGVYSSSGNELVKKSGISLKGLKLFKSRNSKCKNLAESKKPSKSGNSSNFDAKKASPSFPNLEARAAFNRLWLTFTKALILQHFDPECHIQIETDVSGYAIGGVLNHLASETSLDEVITKADLG